MNAWQSVQVSNAESLHNKRAGKVLRTESKDGNEHIFVELDATQELPAITEPFGTSELVQL